jgi:hypothetical protein
VSRLPVDKFVPIYQALQASKVSFVIIGGQACALWARLYDEANPDLLEFQPYVTRDVDLCASTKQDVYAAGNALRVEPKFFQKGSASPELGILTYQLEDAEVNVQILRGGYQISGEEIIKRKQVYRWKEHGLVLEVMHPVLCLHEKAAAVCGIEQRGRQDLKHLSMSLQFVRSFISERIQDSLAADVLQMCQRVLDVSEGRHGMKCYTKRRIKLESAIPIEALRTSESPKLVNFANQEFPRRCEKLERRRTKAAQLTRIKKTGSS